MVREGLSGSTLGRPGSSWPYENSVYSFKLKAPQEWNKHLMEIAFTAVMLLFSSRNPIAVAHFESLLFHSHPYEYVA
jgi:hypothetical protein